MDVESQLEHRYVFVVCGDKEHILALNYSLKHLRQFTDNEILVVSDLSRNAIDIEHNNILDIETPAHYSNHQAAIYLKTGIHKFVELDNTLWCYLDSDVIALNAEVNKIFSHFMAPVTFCTDHCKLRRFSPSAVRQSAEVKAKAKELEDMILSFAEFEKERAKEISDGTDVSIDNNARKINFSDWEIKALKLVNHLLSQSQKKKTASKTPVKQSPHTFQLPSFVAYLLLRIYRPFLKLLLSLFNSGKLTMYEEQGPYHLDKTELEASIKTIPGREEKIEDKAITLEEWVEEKSEFTWDMQNENWLDTKNQVIKASESDDLLKLIQSTFDITVKEPNWQHWNGGVFLFSEISKAFLDTWHKYSIQIFQNPKWATRDQGTLIASAWEFGLENQPTLPIEFNFLADYYHSTMAYKGNLVFDINAEIKNITPNFIHIYHHFGDTSWQVWNDVTGTLTEKRNSIIKS
ncbi:MAG: hypothetical protein AAF502_15805 [Bacteroidota bacterium]